MGEFQLSALASDHLRYSLGTIGRALKGIIPTSRLINWKYCFTNKYFDAKLDYLKW